MIISQQVVLARRPNGRPTSSDFRYEDKVLRKTDEGEVLVRVLYLSLDPYMRGRMDDVESYAPPTPIDWKLEGETICEVLESRHPDFRQGDVVRGRTGWCTHAVIMGAALRPVDAAGAPMTTALGVLGMPGFTAYSGLKAIGQVRQGETVVVSDASGAVGSLVGQLAKLAGARAVGIAGGPDKCRYVKEELGFDDVVDRGDPGFEGELRSMCPNGIDVYFENVGGTVWDAVLPLLNKFARVPLCGLIAHYNGDTGGNEDRLAATMAAMVQRSILIRGFINSDFLEPHYRGFRQEVVPLVASGAIKHREDFVDGLMNAPDAFMNLLEGKSFGKLLVRVGVAA